MDKLRGVLMKHYCELICKRGDVCLLTMTECPLCNNYSTDIISLLRQYLEEKVNQKEITPTLDEYGGGQLSLMEIGFNDCLTKIRTIIQGIK